MQLEQLTRSGLLLVTGLSLLEACGGSDGTGPTTTITVSGHAQDRLGEPIAGARVLVSGQPSVTTGADGGFTITGVAVPYDIALIETGRNTGIVYKGVTRSDPTLLDLFDPGVEQAATVAGSAPLASGGHTLVFFISGRNVVGGVDADPTTGQFTFTVRWHGSATTHTGTLHVLQLTAAANGTPASYDGYASRPLTITAGGTSSSNDFAVADLADPPEQTISGTVALPAGYTLTSRSLFVSFGRVPVVWDEQGTLSNAFTYTVPAVAGTAFSVEALAVDAASRASFFFKVGVAGNSTNVNVPLEAAGQLAAPPDGAAEVDVATSFTWSHGGGVGVDILEALPDNPGGPRFLVLTTAADAKLADLSASGLGLPASASYHWLVDRVAPVRSMDEAASAEFIRLLDLEAGEFSVAVSERFGFSTKAAGAAPITAQRIGQGRRGIGGITIDASK